MDCTIHSIDKIGGIAGQVAYRARVQYEDEPESVVTFYGQSSGVGPVVMETAQGGQIFVTDPSRFGAFGPEWVRRFFA
jgi:hypothetical protein